MKPGDRRLLPRHGGDLTAAARAFGLPPPDGWLDLSTGINPVAYPTGDFDGSWLARLPDPGALDRLVDAAGSCYAAAPAATLLAVPGSELAIRQIPFLVPAEKVAIVGPTYPSHAEAWSETGCEVAEVPELDLIPGDASVVVIANPNSPDGRMTSAAALAAVAEGLARRGGTLIVDEAYADLAPDISLMPLLGEVPAIVLRSLGKFFGLPGLRLGFVAGPREFLRTLSARLGDWPVSTAAIAIGGRALGDGGWQAATRRRLKTDADAMATVLAGHGLGVAGGTDLFRLASVPGARDLYRRLGQRGILTRIFAGQPDWIRFGLPPGSAGRVRLSVALGEILS